MNIAAKPTQTSAAVTAFCADKLLQGRGRR